MKKKICALLVLTLALCWSLAAFAAVRMPENRGALTDDANVLGTLTAKDVMAYASRVEEETGVKLHVALVNFLDGMEVKTYARQLFQRWELGGDDLLLLGAAGEDSFAAVMGSNGQSTPINFKRQFVLAVVSPVTDTDTQMYPLSVLQNGNAIIFNYKVDKGSKMSYSICPFTAVALDRPATNSSYEIYWNER